MPNYPEPGNLANANGVTFTGVAALPGGVVYGRDGQVIREMLGAVSTIRYGDAVILAPSLASLSPYFVTTVAAADSTLRYGIVVGGQVSGTPISAASLPLWVAIEGPAWAIAGASVSLGDLVGTGSVAAGDVVKSVTGRTLRTYDLNVCVSAAVASFTTRDVDVPAPAGFTSLDEPVNWVPNASLTPDSLIYNVGGHTSAVVTIRLANPTASAGASAASVAGTLTTAITSQAFAGGILGVVLTSTSAASLPTLIHIDKR